MYELKNSCPTFETIIKLDLVIIESGIENLELVGSFSSFDSTKSLCCEQLTSNKTNKTNKTKMM